MENNVVILVVAMVGLCFLEYVNLQNKHDEPVQNGNGDFLNSGFNEMGGILKNLLNNIMAIEEHNALFERGETSFRMKLNKFAYLAAQEFAKLRNGFRRLGIDISIPPQLRNFLHRALAFVSPVNVQVIGSVDWRKEFGIDWGVEDQLDCASCWAFSAIGAVEGQIYRKTGQKVALSPQNLIDCATENYGNYGCSGGSMEGAYDYMVQNSLNTAQSYPYEAREGSCRQVAANDAIKIYGYKKIEEGNETQLMEAVATVGPVSAAMDASLQTFQFYSQGIYYDPRCSSTQLDHGVVVVGYGTTQDGNDYWVVKNSYGIDWGEGGYFKLARNRDNHCGIATSATYPVL